MFQRKTHVLVLTALMSAVCALLTLFLRVPSPMGGYVNLGDCGVLLAAWLLGPIPGAVAAGFGSALADVLGYPLYAPATLVIKAGMALIAGWLSPARGRAMGLAGAVAAEGIMVLGYLSFEGLLLGLGAGALANVPFNLVQGGMCLVAALLVGEALRHSHALPSRP